MANTFAPFGFMQASGTGSTPTYEQVPRLALYNASAIYRGDPVASQSDGTIAIGTGNAQIAGIFVGCKYLSVSFQRVIWNSYWPGTDVASDQYPECYIINDPNAQFLAQSDATGLTLADVGSNAIFAVGTPNAYTKQSGAYIDSAGSATTTYPFRIVQIVTTPVLGFSNPVSGAYALAIVAFNNVDTKTLVGVA